MVEPCVVCKKPFDEHAFPIGNSGWCAACATTVLDWINDEVLPGIKALGESAGVERIEPDTYYEVSVDWFIADQIAVEYTIFGETYEPADDEFADDIYSGLELAVQMDRTNRGNIIDVFACIRCNSGRVIPINEVCAEW
ncbi:MAG: hypothetical protein GX825_02590 [Syntrophomonadaceae bacterium]|nr:hypothetical protein [Syntrophomonadaceae bacterium]